MKKQKKEERTATICFLSTEHPPYDKRVFAKEAVSLAGAGFRTIHLCPGEESERKTVRGVEIVTYPRPRGKLGRLFSLPRLYRIARQVGADAYHCNEPDSWLVGVWLRLIHGKIVIFDCHEHYPGQVVRWLPPPLRRLGSFLCRYYLQALGLFSDLVVLAKYSVAADFSWSRRRQLLVLNTTPIAALEGRKAGLTSTPPSVGGDKDSFRFIHLGVIRRERGSEQLLAALEQLAGWGYRSHKVIIVGTFRDGSEQDFFRQAEIKGVRDRIEFHPWMPFEEAFDLVRSCQAGLVLFQKDVLNNVYGMPHKMFDYMLAGLPVIAPDFAPDIVRVLGESGAGILIDTSDPKLLAQAMRDLMDDPLRAAEIGKRGQKAVFERYHWEHDASNLIAAYRRLLAGRGFFSPSSLSLGDGLAQK